MTDSQTALQNAWHQHQAGNIDAAETVYRDVIDQDPKNADAHVYLGIALFDRRHFQESADHYRTAIQLRHQFPIAWNNLGNSLRLLGQVEESDRCFEEALIQQPRYLSALKNRGSLWLWSGEIERGLHWYQQGLAIDPDNAELHRNLGVIELLRGNYSVGWREYRWRWKMPGLQRPKTHATHWAGQELIGKTFLLYPEQGLGDAIQFVRVAKQLKSLGAEVILQCSPKLIDLFSSTTTSLGVDRLVQDTGASPPTDYHASMIDVVDTLFSQTGKMCFGRDLFTDGAGYLCVSEALMEYWRLWFDGQQDAGRKLRIGINWQGNPEHHADVYRSAPLAVFEPLASLPNVQLFNLQFGHGSEQLDSCDFASKILRLPDDVDSQSAFTDTVAIIAGLDHVVTTDTAIAHLAGAVGEVPVHLMLSQVPDWRWLLDGDRTEWYPTTTLYRQQNFGRWDDVMARIVEQIEQRPRAASR
ncbi:Tetratricopeptide repeat protein [Rubripirellula obstinata]|uniref:Tetratricopeptide repeat protein n=1 Tax=Rubripirellula obstinata TaxID=406547 RepID=A0A5B1CNV1_9BACT|nr:tetratricopeptide repeat protein [Rubripirellula obstinata]KAA1261509.1 Tetratricopeptide repeat protein [Rubripirellula obstinata]